MLYIVTGEFAVEHHDKEGNIPGTDEPFFCDFDNSMEFDEVMIAFIHLFICNIYKKSNSCFISTLSQR